MVKKHKLKDPMLREIKRAIDQYYRYGTSVGDDEKYLENQIREIIKNYDIVRGCKQ